jgi:hypothetical protein
MRNIRQWTCLCSVVVLLLATGCNNAKPTGKLQGKVTFEGAAVKDAKIQIQHTQTGEAAVAVVGSAGSYQFERPVTAGEYRVSVEPTFEVPVAGAGGATPAPIKPPERTDIPERYRLPGTSGLTTAVKVGDNTFNVDMKK